MRKSRKEMLNKEFNMFNHIHGESIESIIDRFEELNRKMRRASIICEVGEINTEMLNSLPYSWNENVTTIKWTKNMYETSLTNLTSII